VKLSSERQVSFHRRPWRRSYSLGGHTTICCKIRRTVTRRTAPLGCRRQLLRFLAYAIAPLVLAVAVNGRSSLVQVIRVRGSSMTPTLLDGDIVVSVRLPAAAVRRGDVVVVEGFGPWPLIKRVAAVPGDEQPALRGKMVSASIDSGSITAKLSRGMVFVVGDNSTQSADSRDWGPVSTGAISSIGLAIVWPAYRIRRLRHRILP
jgi:signal peptidase I